MRSTTTDRISRSPARSYRAYAQGSPVIVQAGASEQGRELAAARRRCLAAAQTLEAAQAYYASVKGRMAKYGRHPDQLKIMPA